MVCYAYCTSIHPQCQSYMLGYGERFIIASVNHVCLHKIQDTGASRMARKNPPPPLTHLNEFSFIRLSIIAV